MIRTKFYHKVMDLAIERKRRKLVQRKAERDQANAQAEQSTGYLVGLMLTRNSIYLTKADKDLCDRLYALEPGDNATFADTRKLLKLITTLMPDPRSVIVYKVHRDELDDGVAAVLHTQRKKRKVA